MKNVIINYKNYLENSIDSNGEFTFTLNSPNSKFSLLFGIFSMNLIKHSKIILKFKETWEKKILKNANDYRLERIKINTKLLFDKPYLQLLTFSLSALRILNSKKIDLLIDKNKDLYPHNIEKLLLETGSLSGKPGSGNFAMFYAVILISNNDKILINKWITCHIENINKIGFWGSKLNHLSFQNGYHQHEIFKFLNINIDDRIKTNALKHILNCADNRGHFAPYPGGGACYDYDAVFLLVFLYQKKFDKEINNTLLKLRNSIIEEQNDDGGFCENKYVRPFKLREFIRKVLTSKSINILIERMLHFIFLFRPKNKKITNHWCDYSRKWDESNLWDSWFRLQTIAIIEIYFDHKQSQKWGFINYPGIGFRQHKK